MALPTTKEELDQMINDAVAKAVAAALQKAEEEKQAAVAAALEKAEEEKRAAVAEARRLAVIEYRYKVFISERHRISQITTIPCHRTKPFYWLQRH